MRLILIITCVYCTLLAACGQKGPLILPQEPVPQESAEQPPQP